MMNISQSTVFPMLNVKRATKFVNRECEKLFKLSTVATPVMKSWNDDSLATNRFAIPDSTTIRSKVLRSKREKSDNESKMPR